MRSLILFCLSLAPIAAFSQSKLTGKVASADGDPIPFANVYLFNVKDTSLSKGSMANSAGIFEVAGVKNGTYFLQYSAVGFHTLNSPAFEIGMPGSNNDIGVRILEKEAVSMQTAVASAQKNLFCQEMDRTVINVQNSILSRGSSLLEVLERSPGIQVDRQNNAIMYNGRNSVLIMLNGRVLRLPAQEINNLLDQMRADNIEKIELIGNPPAKYDAEGAAGMINIVLKKDENYGTNGSFTLTGGYGLGPKVIAGVSLNHREGPLNVYGGYTYSYDKSSWETKARGAFQFPQDAGKGHRTSDYLSITNTFRNVHNANVGIDYAVGKNTWIGATSIFSAKISPSDGMIRANYLLYGDSALLLGAASTGKNNSISSINNINVQTNLGREDKLSLGFDYIYYRNNNPSSYLNTYTDKEENDISNQSAAFIAQQRISNLTPIHVFIYSADYERKLGSHVRVNAGFKSSGSSLNNSLDLSNSIAGAWTPDSYISHLLTMKEFIKAAYASASLDLKEVKLDLGLRYEYTNTKIAYDSDPRQAVDRRYGKLFPSLSIRRKLSATSGSTVQLSYNRRIGRPAFSTIAPNVSFNDIYSIYLGNPLLKPTITDNLQLQLQQDRYLLSLQYSNDHDPIVDAQHIRAPGDSSFLILSENLKYVRTLQLQLSFHLQVTSWWKVQNSFSTGWKSFSADIQGDTSFSRSYYQYGLYSSSSLSFHKGFSMELAGYFYSMDYSGMYKRHGFGGFNIGLRKEFKNKSTLQLTAPDPLKLTHYRFDMEPGLAPLSLTSKIDAIPETRRAEVIRLTYSLNFGNDKLKGQRQSGSASQDEQNRIRY